MSSDKAYSAEVRLGLLVARLLGFGPDGSGAASYAGGDGNQYSAGHILLTYTGLQQTISSTSAVTPAGMSCPVAARSYFMAGVVAAVQGPTPAIQALRLTGPAAGSVLAAFLSSNFGDFGAAGVASHWGTVTALNSDLATAAAGGGIAAGFSFAWLFAGEVTFTAAGTFALQARCVTSSADTWIFQAPSHVVLFPC